MAHTGGGLGGLCACLLCQGGVLEGARHCRSLGLEGEARGSGWTLSRAGAALGGKI